jgi:hypothetical protein
MTHHLESIDLFIQPLPPGRMTFALGKQSGAGKSAPAPRRPGAMCMVRLRLRDDQGRRAFGCSGDRPSYGWLDKRPGQSADAKLRALIELVHAARDLYLERPDFESPFDFWLRCHAKVMTEGRRRGHEDLTSSFASALMERAVLDAFCRLHGKSMFQMIREDRLGLRPEKVHATLKGFPHLDYLPPRPLTRFHVRHTVGWVDPLFTADIPAAERVNDGEPESLEEYIRRDGVRYFKVKISGHVANDLTRLKDIWEVIPKEPETALTLDANEAYDDLGAFAELVDRLRADVPGLFQHILFIEQPLSRALTHDPQAEPWIRRIAQVKPVVIDESDGALDAFPRAHALGYAGVSHKNCKGFFKSLLNHALAMKFTEDGKPAFLSGEDLSLMPIVPLQQDFAALGVLGITHCERNGHHYSRGLAHLSAKEKETVARHHRDLYVQRGDEWFLNVRNGQVTCASVQCPGFGVREEPDWAAMQDMRKWLKENNPDH